MTLTILDFQNQKTIIQDFNSAMHVEDYVYTLLGHSSYQFMLSKSLTLEITHSELTDSHITLKSNVCYFNSEIKELKQTINDCFEMAEAIRADIDGGNIEEDNDCLAFDLYNDFSQKYQ